MDGFIACRIDKKAKRWQPIATTGTWSGHTAGKFTLQTEDLETIVANFKRLGLDVVVDYEHQSLYGDKAPASGWIRHPDGLRVQDGALVAYIEWTDAAKAQIKAGEYRYLSPTLVPHGTDPKSGEDVGWTLHSVALTNTPFFNELPPIAAKNQSSHKKETEMTKEQMEALQAENSALKAELSKTNEKLEEMKKVAASAKVKDAIAAKKLHPEQEQWACDYAIKDPDGFDAYLEAAKPQPDVPQSDIYPATNKPAEVETIDMSRI